MDYSRATEDLGGGGGNYKGHMIALLLSGTTILKWNASHSLYVH
jgi:hypothetical protein